MLNQKSFLVFNNKKRKRVKEINPIKIQDSGFNLEAYIHIKESTWV